eukprot:764501-Prorocentrum_minimum.AAC.1
MGEQPVLVDATALLWPGAEAGRSTSPLLVLSSTMRPCDTCVTPLVGPLPLHHPPLPRPTSRAGRLVCCNHTPTWMYNRNELHDFPDYHSLA